MRDTDVEKLSEYFQLLAVGGADPQVRCIGVKIRIALFRAVE